MRATYFAALWMLLNGLLLCCPAHVNAKGKKPELLNRFSYHFQLTAVGQWHPDFHSPYAGQNSLLKHEGIQTSLTSTLFLGVRLWKGAELYFDPELAGGSGLSSTLGVAGFPNGETFRVGDPKPTVYVARGYFKQTIWLTKDFEYVADDVNQVATKVPKHSLSFQFGKMSMADVYDDNAFAHDPRTQFLNWSLMNNGAWDYPANTRGYTFALVAQYRYYNWYAKVSTSLMPKVANGPDLEWNMKHSHSETVEIEHRHDLFGRKGAFRLLGYFTSAPMGSYADAVQLDTANVAATRKTGRIKAGFGVSFDQQAMPWLGFFVRGGWNDGHTETWAFTEIDNTVSFGLAGNGKPWGRYQDQWGLAFSRNGISPNHRKYLAAGGYGFIIGDGQLPNYKTEWIMELYYSLRPFRNWLYITPDYQLILHPAYNADRGPVNVIGLRVHVEI
jgi:high affinity Mn2+ porin